MDGAEQDELPQINNLRLRELAQHAPIGVCITDPNGIDVLINEQWCAMTGLTIPETRNLGWLSSVHPEDRERVAREIARSRAEGTPYSMEHRFQKPDGSITWVVLKAATVTDSVGRRGGYIAGMLYLASSPEIEQNLVRVTQQAGEAIRQKLDNAKIPEIPHLVRKEIEQARNMLCIQMVQESSLKLGKALETIFRLSVKGAGPG